MKFSLAKMSLSLYLNSIIPTSTSLLCTISGGQDSQLTFYLFLHLKKYLNLNLKIIYCQHFWQCFNFSNFWEIWKITFVFEIPFAIILTEKKLYTEDQARNWRKENFNRLTQFYLSQYISFGHTGTDQMETAFWNLFRGTSPKGLSNLKTKIDLTKPLSNIQFRNSKKFLLIQKNKVDNCNKFQCLFEKKYFPGKSYLTQIYFFHWGELVSKNNLEILKINFKYLSSLNKKIILFNLPNKFNILKRKKITKVYCINQKFSNLTKIIRPLLFYHRQDIKNLIQGLNLPIIPDKTNQISNLTRNKIRAKLFPFLRQNFNQFSDNNLYQFVSICHEEQKFLKFLRKKLLRTACNNFSFKNISLGLQRQLLHEILSAYSNRQISMDQVELIRFQLYNKF